MKPLFDRNQLLSALIKKSRDLHPSIRKGTPQFSEVSPLKLPILKDVVIAALKTGLTDLIAGNVEIDKYEPFSDALATQIVGKVNVNMQLVVKMGDEALKRQIDLILSQKPQYQRLYPSILATHESHGTFACLMEYLSDYSSVHEMIYKGAISDLWELTRAVDSIFNTLFEVYRSEYDDMIRPNLENLYIRERIEKRISIFKAQMNEKPALLRKLGGLWPGRPESLFDTYLVYEGATLEPFNKVMPQISKAVTRLTPNFSTLVHGDAHPGNIMINLSESPPVMKFIDPNPYIEKADYMYDIGKLYHWLEKMGFIVLEKSLDRKFIKVSSEVKTKSLLKVEYSFRSQISSVLMSIEKIEKMRLHALKCCNDKLAAMTDAFKDMTWEPRLYLSIACAYLGGLHYFEDPSHVILVFAEGLKFLNKAMRFLNAKAT